MFTLLKLSDVNKHRTFIQIFYTDSCIEEFSVIYYLALVVQKFSKYKERTNKRTSANIVHKVQYITNMEY